MEKMQLYPRLRFPEFYKMWEIKTLEYCSKVIGGGTPDTTIEEYWNGDIQWFTPTEIKTNYVSKSERTITALGLSKSSAKLLPPGTILLTTRATIGEVAIAQEQCSVNQGFQSLIINEKANNVFVANWIRQNKNEFLKRANGSTFAEISKSEIEKIQISLPNNIEEQQKIASFLTVVDKRIELLIQKMKELEQYKKGIMQKIFNQEIRFKDNNGNDFPEWESKTLGEIGVFQTSSIDKLSQENEKEVFLVNYMNVYRHESINNRTVEQLQKVTASDNQILSCDLKKGDILFTPSSETPNDIGHSVVIFENLKDTVYSYHLMRFRPTIEIDLLYSHHFCNDSNVLAQLSRLSTGSTRFTISVKAFSSVVVLLPDIQEQKIIASFLSAIDNKIEKANSQIGFMKNWKKGLLQQMFV